MPIAVETWCRRVSNCASMKLVAESRMTKFDTFYIVVDPGMYSDFRVQQALIETVRGKASGSRHQTATRYQLQLGEMIRKGPLQFFDNLMVVQIHAQGSLVPEYVRQPC